MRGQAITRLASLARRAPRLQAPSAPPYCYIPVCRLGVGAEATCSLSSCPVFVINAAKQDKLSYSIPALYVTKRLYVAAAAGGSSKENDGMENDDEEDFDVEDLDVDDLEEDDEGAYGGQIETGGTNWGQTTLEAVQQLLDGDDDFELYSFRAFAGNKRVDVRLDKLSDKYGSPTLDDITEFARKLNAALEQAMGEEAAGDIEIEVSSAGADRTVRVPGELARFAELPMAVEYKSPSDGTLDAKVLQFAGYTKEGQEVTTWRLADVAINRSGKGRPLNKKQRETVIEIAAADITQVRVYFDL